MTECKMSESEFKYLEKEAIELIRAYKLDINLDRGKLQRLYSQYPKTFNSIENNIRGWGKYIREFYKFGPADARLKDVTPIEIGAKVLSENVSIDNQNLIESQFNTGMGFMKLEYKSKRFLIYVYVCERLRQGGIIRS